MAAITFTAWPAERRTEGRLSEVLQLNQSLMQLFLMEQLLCRRYNQKQHARLMNTLVS